MKIIGWLVETKLCTDGEDCINLVKYLGQAVYFSLTDILSVNVRLDRAAAGPVSQAHTVGDPEGSFYVGVPHPHQTDNN